jgi:hypothetical protein
MIRPNLRLLTIFTGVDSNVISVHSVHGIRGSVQRRERSAMRSLALDTSSRSMSALAKGGWLTWRLGGDFSGVTPE